MTGVWQDALSYILTSPPDHQPGSVQSPGQVRAESYPPLPLEDNLTPHLSDVEIFMKRREGETLGVR